MLSEVCRFWDEFWTKYCVQRVKDVDEAGWCVGTGGVGFWTTLRNLPFILLSMKTYLAGLKKDPKGSRRSLHFNEMPLATMQRED